MILDITYYNHCDDGSCDLGFAEWHCPSCGRQNNDYNDMWWNQHEKVHEDTLECEKCNDKFKVNKVEYGEYKINIEGNQE